MKHVPILFSTPMVKSLIDLTKKLTRRTKNLKEINNHPNNFTFFGFQHYPNGERRVIFINIQGEPVYIKLPYGDEGDILWVRETYAKVKYFNGLNENDMNVYKASLGNEPVDWNWKPSIFMPKEACRLFLEVTNVRVERLHDISEEDAVKEGIKSAECESMDGCIGCKGLGDCQAKGTYWDYMNPSGECGFPSESAVESFNSLWESINGKESLESNPWVWVYDFKPVDKPDNFI